MSFLKFLGVLSPAYTLIDRIISGSKEIGRDQFGNIYYTADPRKGYKRERRWVMYKDEPEASKVPPEWHGWLHYQTDEIPSENDGHRRNWQKPHTPNLTGTTGAYRPPGHVLEGGKRNKATGDYEAWIPQD